MQIEQRFGTGSRFITMADGLDSNGLSINSRLNLGHGSDKDGHTHEVRNTSTTKTSVVSFKQS